MTSPVDTSVKYFHSGMVGAPVLNGIAGSLIAVLDACLLNGWGIKTVTSLVVGGNIAVMTTSAGFAAEVGAVVLVSGATPSTLNGEQKVTAVTATTVSFATTGIADQTATGTITFKQAPLGWVSDFSGTNIKTYRSNETTATKSHLRVDDSVVNVASTGVKVVGYVTMSDINTGTDQFPRDIDTTGDGGLRWIKSEANDSSARNWIVWGDGRIFYISVASYTPYGGGNNYCTHCFGDPLMTKSADPWGCILEGMTVDIGMNSTAHATQYGSLSQVYQAAGVNIWNPRSHTGLGFPTSSVKTVNLIGAPSASPNYHGGRMDANAVIYPNATDGGLYLSQIHVSSGYIPRILRCVLPGVYFVPMRVDYGVFLPLQSVKDVFGLAGRVFKCTTFQESPSTTPTNCVPDLFFDITGPWR